MPEYKPIYLVTTSLNAAETILETLDSVFLQKKLAPIFYHIHDGGSTDGTQEILSRYSNRFEFLKNKYSVIFSWDSAEDRGMYDGITEAVKKIVIPPDCYMGWLNADDRLFPGAIQTIQEIEYDLPNVEWLGGIPLIANEQGQIIARGRSDFVYPQFLIRQGVCDGLHWRNLQQEGIFWRKRLWDKVGGVNKQMQFAGDWDLWRRMANHTCYLQVPKYIAIFSRRAGQLSEGNVYGEEINSILSLEERRLALRSFIRDIKNVLIPTIVQQSDGTWSLSNQCINIKWKDALGIFLSSYGAYTILRWVMRLNSKIKSVLKCL